MKVKNKIIFIMCLIISVALSGCAKEAKAAEIEKNPVVETEQGAGTSKPADTNKPSNDLEAQWFSMFEDPIFAQALLNYNENRFQKQLDEELWERFMERSLSVKLDQTNNLTGESLPDNYREQITSIQGIEKFASVIGDFEIWGLVNVSRENLMGTINDALEQDKEFVISDLRIANTQIDNLSFISKEYIEYLTSIDISYTLVDDAGIAPLLASSPTGIHLSGSKVTKLPAFNMEKLKAVSITDLQNFDFESMNILLDAKDLTTLRVVNTPTNIEFISQLKSLLNLRIGGSYVNGYDLIKLQPKAFSKLKLFLPLTDYTGFGEYLKGGYHPDREVLMYDTVVNQAFIDSLKGLSDKDQRGFHLVLNNPTWDFDLPVNSEQDGIKIFNLVQVYYPDEETYQNNRMPDEIKSYFLLSQFAEAIAK